MLLKKIFISNLNKVCPINRCSEKLVNELEENLLNTYCIERESIRIIFILASPRTGSTLLYQLLCKYFNLYYFSNYVVKYFPKHPIIGAIFESSILSKEGKKELTLYNEYGKTKKNHEPNEASEILQNWFCFKHPAEIKSNKIIPGKRSHMIKTIGGICNFTDKSMIIKNAWNCFRVKELSSLFPAAHFIWLRRNIIDCSYSTLLARKTQGNPNKVWNSASPFNYYQIKKLPYYEQVVEQQYWTNEAVKRVLNKNFSDKNWTEIWYENILSNPRGELIKIANKIEHVNIENILYALDRFPIKLNPSNKSNTDKDFIKIEQYSRKKYPHLINSDKIPGLMGRHAKFDSSGKT